MNIKKRIKKHNKGNKMKSIQEAGIFDPSADLKISKVRITTYLDSDVLEFIKIQAKKSKEGYQTLLNSILRDFVILSKLSFNAKSVELKETFLKKMESVLESTWDEMIHYKNASDKKTA